MYPGCSVRARIVRSTRLRSSKATDLWFDAGRAFSAATDARRKSHTIVWPHSELENLITDVAHGHRQTAFGVKCKPALSFRFRHDRLPIMLAVKSQVPRRCRAQCNKCIRHVRPAKSGGNSLCTVSHPQNVFRRSVRPPTGHHTLSKVCM